MTDTTFATTESPAAGSHSNVAYVARDGKPVEGRAAAAHARLEAVLVRKACVYDQVQRFLDWLDDTGEHQTGH